MKTLILILSLAIFGFASDCATLYNKMIKTLPEKQKTTICRVTGIGETREDIMGFFFNFEVGGKKYPAVLVYGTDYPEMLYSGDDDIVKNASCIENNGYRKVNTNMTARQVLNKLFSFKTCEDGFSTNHVEQVGKIYL